jgi:hypothetical protein
MAITRWSTPDVMAITKWSIPVEAHRRHEMRGMGENDVFAGTVHGRSGGLPECIGCKRG